MSPANAGIRRGLFLPMKRGKGKGKGRPPSPTDGMSMRENKSIQDCQSNIPAVYYYGYWGDVAAAEIHRRTLATKEHRGILILEQHLDEIAQNADNSSNSDAEDNTLHENLESVYDCKMDCLDSEFLLAYNLSFASRNKGKRTFSSYQFTRKQIVAQRLQTAEDASKDASPKDIENLIKGRMPNSVWEIFHSQRRDRSLHLIRDMK